MKHITIKDIAHKLNISVSSVSRAFNDKYDIKKETKQLILKTAEEMGYYPNPIARKLHQKCSFNIGVVVPEFINEFYAEIVVALQEVFIANGYQVLFMHSDNQADQELSNVKTLIHNMVDGIVIAPTEDSENFTYYLQQVDAGCPMVFVNRIEESLSVSKVIFDNKKWSYFATEHLLRQGYKNIYHLSSHPKLSVGADRADGFIKAMRNYNIPEDQYKVIETGLLAEEGIHIVEDLIYKQDIPEAFFCINDVVAMGVIKTLKNHNIKIPEDVAVMGFTETQMADLISPPLSSIKQPTFEMGKAAAKLLLKQIESDDMEPETIIMNGKLNVRLSSSRP